MAIITDTLTLDGESIAGSGGSSKVGYLPAGTGAVATTVQAKLRESVSVKDFGVVGVGDETAKVQAAFTASDIVVGDMTPITTGALSTVGKTFEWPAGMYSTKVQRVDPIDAADLSPAPILDYLNDSRHMYSMRFGNAVARDVYEPIYPSINHFDAFNAVLQISAGSTIEHGAAVSGYVQLNDASPVNGVALFGCAMGTVDNAHVWGINTLLQDSATRAAGTATGRKLINELDFNVMNPDTEVIGCSIGGNSLAQSNLAQAFLVNSLGTGIKWTKGFVTIDGAVDSTTGAAYVVGAAEASGPNIASQRMVWNWRDGADAAQAMVWQHTGGLFVISSTAAWNGLSLQSGDIWLDSAAGIRVGGNVVIGGRKVGWDAATGTATRTTFATTTVTTAQLAERVKALIDDFISHGAIGA